jgi:trigger factor
VKSASAERCLNPGALDPSRPSPRAGWQNGRTVETKVQELPENRVRLEVEVPSDHIKHAVEHASSDLAASTKIPGFRKGKVPKKVLEARLGRDRIMSEAVESHIGGWFWNAAERASIRPVAQPTLDYELPTSDDEPFSFTAEVAVQPRPEVADWSGLEVPAPEPEVPQELIEGELEALRSAVAELVPVDDRPAKDGDVLVTDLVDETGDAQRDYVVQLGSGRLVEEIERALRGMRPGETRKVSFTAPEGQKKEAELTVKEIKEPVLPALDDELARAASEFETLDELRGEIESRLHEAIQAELEADFRAAAVDKLVEASKVEVSAALVEARTPRPTSASPVSQPSSCARTCATRRAVPFLASSSSKRSRTSWASRSTTRSSEQSSASRPKPAARTPTRSSTSSGKAVATSGSEPTCA